MRYFFALLLLTNVSPLLATAADIDFNRDIRPILSDRCYFCHGPDEENREADLRFDLPDAATEVFLSGELVRRILSDDPDEVMPPPATKLSLTASEKELLEAWIAGGAQYAAHWAFQPLPATVALPQTKNKAWPQHPFDAFVLAKLEAEQLQPTAPADPLRWLRRVTFDLTGLPPSAMKINAFQHAIANDADSAYEATVDRLLASSAYGEHMAVTWLDAARYADSYGYQSDKLNTQWPYRDWVVSAFNDNLPYDDFLTWQLAGDLLDNPTREQRLATAFNRTHRLNNEGGAVFEEWRIENVADRVHTFGTAVLGLTMECSRCHDHKYDPISMRDYYSLSAFFNSIDENGLYDRTAKVPSPTMLLPTTEQSALLEAATKNLVAADAAYHDAVTSSAPRRAIWLQQNQNAKLIVPDQRLALDFDQPFDEEQKKLTYPSTDDRKMTSPLERVEVEGASIPRLLPAAGPRRAILLDGERGITIKEVEPFDRWIPFSLAVTFREPQREPRRSIIAHHSRGTDAGFNGWDLSVVDGHVESRLYRVWPGNAIGVRTKEPIPVDCWQQLTATYDGSSTAAGLKLYLDGLPLAVEVLRDKIVKSSNVDVDHGGQLTIGQRFRARGLAGGLIDDVRLYDRELTPTEIRYLANGAPLSATLYYASAIDEQCRAATKKLREARHAYVLAEEVMQEVPIMEELDQPRPTHLLARGQYDAPTSDETLVPRQTFTKLGPAFPTDAQRDRLGLAQWVTAPDHPLTARVVVNRLWANFFGTGLVRTPENFGSQGELPTHPALLDWLARDFIAHDWDVKRFCKKVVLSATYQQNSAASPTLITRDPDNRLLARGPAYRLGAEQIRDLALAASGLLSHERGGPPVSPYQPGKDLWVESNSMSPAYQQSVGKALHRRSLYSVWKRTAPLPNMMAFDTSSREVCTVRRSRTNTPLQALVLMNDVQFVEVARVLAEKLLLDDLENDHERLAAAFVALASCQPDPTEQRVLLELLTEERTYYESYPDEAQKLIALGDTQPNKDVSPVELAALTTVCQAILNLDATIWNR